MPFLLIARPGARACLPIAHTPPPAGGDFFLATVTATTLTKLALRSRQHVPAATAHLVAADVLLLLTGMLVNVVR